MENRRIAEVFEQIADILEIQGENPFRIRSYRAAARAVADLPERLEDLQTDGRDFTDLPGIGESLAAKIHEILESGTCAMLEDLRKALPPHLPDLLGVKGLGPKKVKALFEQLGIASLDDLKAAAEAGKIRDLPGMGAKTEENVLHGLATLAAEKGRISIQAAAEQMDALGRHLEGIRAVWRWAPAGSLRRRRETIGDLDVLVVAADRARAAEAILAYGPIRETVGRGEEKVSVRLEGGVQVDFRFVEADAFGAAQMYFTGSKAHNIVLRKRAQKKGLKLSEYGLFRGKRRIAGRTEEEVFRALGLDWISPELREDRGEVGAAAAHALPRLLEPRDVKGDLHAHTDATDGADTVEAMAQAARARGYQYLAITDHSRAVTVAHGLDEARLRRHADHIREVDAATKGFRVLAGIEVDILKDGRLDLPEKVLAGLDWVVASVHSAFALEEAAMTDRILAAVRSGVVHCLGHPFGRLIGRRDPIRFDADRVFEACREAKVCLEVSAHPDRLDLPDVYCKRARDLGATMVISTDAHRRADLDLMVYGVGVARRGWLGKADVLNTLGTAAFLKRIRRG